MPWLLWVNISKKFFRRKRHIASPPEASSRTSSKDKKGSLTVEAAVVLPLFFIGMLALICVMDIQRVKSEITVSLNESVKELGMYAYALGGLEDESPLGGVDDVICIAYAQSKLKSNSRVSLNTLRSSYHQNMVELWVMGKYRLPISLLPIPDIPFQSRVRVHDWTGYSGNDENESRESSQMVYVTEHQSVYHTSSKCTHLNLSIMQTTAAKVGGERNENGAKYHECNNCVDGSEHLGIVYITKSGSRYHAKADCHSLKRSVKLVLQETVSNLSECSRCLELGG